MEPFWSPVGATGGNQSQIRMARTPRKQAKTVDIGCDRLPKAAHGKEVVDDSSPSEGSRKGRHEIEQSFGAIFADHETGRYVGKIRAEPRSEERRVGKECRR